MIDNSLKLRAFLAIELDQPSREYVRVVSERLRSSRSDVSWVKASNAHITLKFLGDISLSMKDSIEKSIKSIVLSHNSFELRLRGLGAFPNVVRPRVVWIGIQDRSNSMRMLFDKLEPVFESLDFPRERRAFNPHLTLGRVRSSSGNVALRKLLIENRDEDGPCFTVNHCVLLRSELKPSGAVYSELARFDMA